MDFSKRARVDQELQAIAAANRATVRNRWEQAAGSQAPKIPARILALDLAYRAQADAYGRLPKNIARELGRALPTKSAKSVTHPWPQVSLPTGTELMREFKGVTYHVRAIDGGFEMDGVRFRSLSAVSRTITGTNYPGPRFFGLRDPAHNNCCGTADG